MKKCNTPPVRKIIGPKRLCPLCREKLTYIVGWDDDSPDNYLCDDVYMNMSEPDRLECIDCPIHFCCTFSDEGSEYIDFDSDQYQVTLDFNSRSTLIINAGDYSSIQLDSIIEFEYQLIGLQNKIKLILTLQ